MSKKYTTRWFGASRGRILGGLIAALLVFGFVTDHPAHAQRILFHGGGAGPTTGDDGAVMAHLQTLLGADNVTYMQGAVAADDGSSATGFDAIIISATLDSGTIRGKYEDIAIPVINWEQAVARSDEGGNFALSENGQTQTGLTQIEILDPTHPLANGLSAGTVTVLNSPHTMSFGNNGLGAGVARVAKGPDSNDHAILAADTGDALFGDGVNNPAIAPARRVHFFLENTGFSDLTLAGVQLFNNALQFALDRDEPFPIFIGGNGTIAPETLPIDAVEFNSTRQDTSVPGLTMDVYGDVNLGSSMDWTDFLAGVPTPAASGDVPWINWDEVPDNAAELFAPNSYADAQPILDAGLTNDGDAAAPDLGNYSVRMTGEIRIPNSEVRFKDGNDDYAYLAIDLDGNDRIEQGEVLIDDNGWTPWNGANVNDGTTGSPIAVANFTGSLAGEDAWRRIEFRMAEGGGDDNAALFWDQNPAGLFDEFTTSDIFMTDAEMVPQDSFRTFQEELTSVAITSRFGGTAAFDVLVEQLDWDRLKMPGPSGGVFELEGSEFQINVLDPDNLESGFTMDIIRDENAGEIRGTPTFTFLNTDEADWDTSMFNVNGQITFTGGVGGPIPGDYNNNGRVEQADLDLVLLNWNESVDNLPADWINERPTSGIIDQAELDGVLLNWNRTTPGLGAASAVPEPSALALLLVAAGLGLGLARKRSMAG